MFTNILCGPARAKLGKNVIVSHRNDRIEDMERCLNIQNCYATMKNNQLIMVDLSHNAIHACFSSDTGDL